MPRWPSTEKAATPVSDYAAVNAQYQGGSYDAVIVEIDPGHKHGEHYHVWFEIDREYAWLKRCELSALPTARLEKAVRARLPTEFSLDNEVDVLDLTRDGQWLRAYVRDAVVAVDDNLGALRYWVEFKVDGQEVSDCQWCREQHMRKVPPKRPASKRSRQQQQAITSNKKQATISPPPVDMTLAEARAVYAEFANQLRECHCNLHDVLMQATAQLKSMKSMRLELLKVWLDDENKTPLSLDELSKWYSEGDELEPERLQAIDERAWSLLRDADENDDANDDSSLRPLAGYLKSPNRGPLSQAFARNRVHVLECRFVLINLGKFLLRVAQCVGGEMSVALMLEEVSSEIARAVDDSRECLTLDENIKQATGSDAVTAIEIMERWTQYHQYADDETKSVACFEASVQACSRWMRNNVKSRDDRIDNLQAELTQVTKALKDAPAKEKVIISQYRSANASGLKETGLALRYHLKIMHEQTAISKKKAQTLAVSIEESKGVPTCDFDSLPRVDLRAVFELITTHESISDECRQFLITRITPWLMPLPSTEIAHQPTLL